MAALPGLSDLTTRSKLDNRDKIDCLTFLHGLFKTTVGSTEDAISPCIKIIKFHTLHRKLFPYQIAWLLFRGPVPGAKVISHLCCHEKKGSKSSDDPRVSPCINPWHMEAATDKENSGRDAHQIALVKYLVEHRVELGKKKHRGPIRLAFKDKSKTSFTGSTKVLRSSRGDTCYHLKHGDCCFLNFRKLDAKQKGLIFYEISGNMRKLVDEVNVKLGGHGDSK